MRLLLTDTCFCEIFACHDFQLKLLFTAIPKIFSAGCSGSFFVTAQQHTLAHIGARRDLVMPGVIA